MVKPRKEHKIHSKSNKNNRTQKYFVDVTVTLNDSEFYSPTELLKDAVLKITSPFSSNHGVSYRFPPF